MVFTGPKGLGRVLSSKQWVLRKMLKVPSLYHRQWSQWVGPLSGQARFYLTCYLT
jgi:hypothetical protein